MDFVSDANDDRPSCSVAPDRTGQRFRVALAAVQLPFVAAVAAVVAVVAVDSAVLFGA